MSYIIHENSKKPFFLNIHLVVLYRLLIVIFIFSLCRLLFYFLNQSLFPNLNGSAWINIFNGGIRFDLVAALYANALVILVSLFPVQLRYNATYQNFIRWLFILFNSFAILLNCIDFVSFQFTLRRISADVIREFSGEQGKTAFLFQFLSDYWFLILIFLGLLFILIRLYDLVKVKIPSSFIPKNYYIGSIAVYLLTITALIYGIRGDFKHSSRPLTNTDAGRYVNHSHEIPLVLNSAFCFVRTMGLKFFRKDSYFSESEVENVYTPVHQLHSEEPFNRMNVMIILLESFGKEAIGFYNGKKGYTPFLDSLCKVSRVCLNSYANGRKSVDAMPAVLAGLPKAEVPFILTPYVSNKLNSLPGILRDSGYTTSFFHGAPNGSMGFNSFTKLAGIDRYYGMTEYNQDDDFDGLWGIWDEPFFQFTAKTLDTIQKPFFATLFSVSSHHPFKLPEKYKGLIPEGEHPLHKCLSYTDLALRKFFETASRMEWFDNTIFVIAADHSTVSLTPEYNTVWGRMSIPLIFYCKSDSTLIKVDSSIVQHTDIAPSVLSYLNYKGRFVSFGKNIFEPNHLNFAAGYLDEFYWMENEYLIQFNGFKLTGFYNLKEDALMKRDLKDSDRSQNIKKELEDKLKAYIQQFHNRMIEDRLTQ
ncbi:MAG: LTA synthase family protein [Saprospiraceae bacterium]|nr:LTA synthase family protein [Saprospiraceae bacterium]